MENNSNIEKKPRKENLWLKHCQNVKAENPNLAYKDILRKAKDSYKPSLSASSKSAGETPKQKPSESSLSKSDDDTPKQKPKRSKSKKEPVVGEEEREIAITKKRGRKKKEVKAESE